MKKLILTAIIATAFISLTSCSTDEQIQDMTHLPQHHFADEEIEIPDGVTYMELEHYFDENGNPLDQDEITRKLELQFAKNKTYTYREARAEAIELIKHYESFKSKLYKCPAGKTTLGYGMTGKYIKGRKTITKAQASQELKYIYDEIYENIKKELGYKLPEQQMAALVSFAFNLGEGALYKSTMFKMLKSKNTEIGNEMLKFVYAKHPETGEYVKLRGLETRRKSELNLFNV